MDISIIICTYNRCQNLADCFAHLNKQVLNDQIEWEIILVDNNSSDDTKNTVFLLSNQYKLNIHYVFEAEQGLSAARNRGIKEANGEYLIFIDDDIRVTDNWLQTIFSVFNTYNSEAVGGRIHIDCPTSLPEWITPDMYGFLGHQDFGEQEHEMDGIKEFPFGGNMAVSKRVFEKIGDFNVNMGRKGEGLKKEELYKGEETDFFHRLTKAGGKMYYHPDALVLHKILPHQLERKFFLTLHNNAGILRAKQDQMNHPRKFFGIPLFIFPQFIRSVFRYLHKTITEGPNKSFRQLMTVYYFMGMISHYKKL